MGPDWAAYGVFTLFAFLFGFVGAQFIALGVLGEYIGRIFQVVRERPAYVLRDVPDEGAANADESPRKVKLIPTPRTPERARSGEDKKS